MVEAVEWSDKSLSSPFAFDDPDIKQIGFGERFVTERTSEWISPWGFEALEVIFDRLMTSRADKWVWLASYSGESSQMGERC